MNKQRQEAGWARCVATPPQVATTAVSAVQKKQPETDAQSVWSKMEAIPRTETDDEL